MPVCLSGYKTHPLLLFTRLYTDDQSELFELLACVAIFRENQFLDLIDQTPNFLTDEWSDDNPHPFQDALDEAYRIANVTD